MWKNTRRCFWGIWLASRDDRWQQINLSKWMKSKKCRHISLHGITCSQLAHKPHLPSSDCNPYLFCRPVQHSGGHVSQSASLNNLTPKYIHIPLAHKTSHVIVSNQTDLGKLARNRRGETNNLEVHVYSTHVMSHPCHGPTRDYSSKQNGRLILSSRGNFALVLINIPTTSYFLEASLVDELLQKQKVSGLQTRSYISSSFRERAKLILRRRIISTQFPLRRSR